MSRGFNHAQDDKISFDTSESVKVYDTFDEMGLKEDLLRGIYAYSPSGFLVSLSFLSQLPFRSPPCP